MGRGDRCKRNVREEPERKGTGETSETHTAKAQSSLSLSAP